MALLRMRIVFSDFAIGVWPVAAGILCVLLIVMWRRKRSLSYLFCFSVFGVYLLFAVDKVFFPLQVSGEYVDAMRQQPFTSGINLAPFYFGAFSALILNVVLTIPFGFGVNFVAQVRAKHFLWLAPAVGLGIEMIQLAISLILRYPYRVVDVNDALLNALGVLIGYGLFRVFAWLYIRSGIRREGLGAYVYDVARRAHL